MKQPKLVAALIAGNEEHIIERCVRSLKKLVDDIVVVRAIGGADPDKTLDIAKKLGCHTAIYRNSPICASWPHLDHFANARNISFERAYDLAGQDGWVMWADCDDILQENMVEPHEKAIRDCKADCQWIMTDYVIPEQSRRAPRERLFRYRTGWWTRPVHENVHPAMTCGEKPSSVKIWTRRDLEIIHAPGLHKRGSNERNMRILAYNDSFTPHFKFYQHYENLIIGQNERAVRYGKEALALENLDGVHRYEVLLNLSNLSPKPQMAFDLAQAAFKLDPARREAIAVGACILLDMGHVDEALTAIEQMEAIQAPSFQQWTHRNEWYGWKAAQLKAWALRMAGRGDEATEVESAVLKQARKDGLPIISLIHATRGRPIKAVQTMTQWFQRARYPERVQHIFATDADDATARHLERFGGVIQSNPEGYSVGAWNLAAQYATGDIIVQLSDDWECPPGWDEMIAERLDIEKPQVLRISDGYRKDDLLCMAILTARYYAAHELFDPRFRNVYSDTDFTFRAEKNGAIVDARDVMFIHHHPFWEKTELDTTYQRGNDPAEYERAKKLFEEIHGN